MSFSLKLVFRLSKISVIVLAVLTSAISSCTPVTKVSEDEIHAGMTIEEVKEKFGEPSFEMSPANVTTLTYGQTVIGFDTSGKAIVVNNTVLDSN